jgi:hypothetical protein
VERKAQTTGRRNVTVQPYLWGSALMLETIQLSLFSHQITTVANHLPGGLSQKPGPAAPFKHDGSISTSIPDRSYLSRLYEAEHLGGLRRCISATTPLSASHRRSNPVGRVQLEVSYLIAEYERLGTSSLLIQVGAPCAFDDP